MINAALVGLGRWGRRLVDAVQENGVPKSSKIQFKRAVVRTAANAEEFAGVQKLALSTSLQDVLADPGIDAIVLATPHDTHVPQILEATRARKHVFVEKPLALHLTGAEAATRSAREHDVVLSVGFNRRFLPAARRLHDLVLSPSFGTLVHLEGTFCNSSGLTYQEGMWRAAESGAKSAMTAMGVHILDFLIYLAGPIRTVRTTSTRRAMAVAVDDVVSVDLMFQSGATGNVRTMLTTPRQWRVQTFGTSQWAHMRDEHLLDLCTDNGDVASTSFDAADTLRLELEAFADAIEGQAPYPMSAAEVLHGVAALEAILESAETGNTTLVRAASL